MLQKKIITFILPDAYSLFDVTTHYPFGGAELRSSILARYLARNKNFEINFITNNHNQIPFQKIDGVNVLADRYNHSSEKKSSLWLKSINAVCNFKIKLFYLLKVKKKFDWISFIKNYWLIKTRADLYFIFNMTHVSLAAVDYCINYKKKYCFFLASDEELNIENSKLGIKKENIEKVLGNACKIIAQNKFQEEKLNQLFGKKAYVMNNPVVISEIERKDNKQDFVLWVGKSNTVKRPYLFIELAKRYPQKKFVMVCNKSHDEIHTQVVSNLPENITFYERLSFDEVEKLFAEAYLYVSTSEFEGFPNTFLQAGKYAVPVISTNVNPNNYITSQTCGIICNSLIDELSSALDKLYDDKQLHKKMSENHLHYIQQNHEASKVVNGLIKEIDSF